MILSPLPSNFTAVISMAQRKRVVWDEGNLANNEEYRKLHPVTMKIDEPKTPYHPSVAIEEEGTFDEEHIEKGTWDPEVNAIARKVKLEAPLERTELPAAQPSAKAAKKGVSLSLAPVIPEQAEHHDKQQHEAQFKSMRKAVYADEGKQFRALLAKSDEVEET